MEDSEGDDDEDQDGLDYESIDEEEEEEEVKETTKHSIFKGHLYDKFIQLCRKISSSSVQFHTFILHKIETMKVPPKEWPKDLFKDCTEEYFLIDEVNHLYFG